MKRLSPSPTLSDFVKQVPGIVDQWLHQVTLRFGVIRQPTTPGTQEIPNNQWGIFKNTTTGDLTLSLNDDGVVKSTLLTTGGGGGDVLGPASAINNHVAFFDGTTGKRIKDSGLTLSGTNTGDQTSIVGITGTLAQFNTALTDADFATGGGTATGTNTGDQTITLTGDVTGSGTGSFATTLKNTGTAGTYVVVTTDAKGRVTSGTTTQAWSTLTGTPTTISGYGITDAQPLDGDLTAIAALAGTSGLLRKTGANTWSLDTSTYLTGNQSITFSGDATGSGTTSITVAVGKIGGKTVSLGGNLTTSGAFASTFTMTGVTAVTFPTSGTLAVVNGNLGTPSAITLTNGTGLPISTGVSGLGSNVASFLAIPSSANFASMITDETGTGSVVLATKPVLTTPAFQSGFYIQQSGITSKAAAATLTFSEIFNGIVNYTGAAATLTTPTAANFEADLTVTAYANLAFDFSVINTGSGTVTIGAGVGVTITGTATVASGASGMFRVRRFGATDYRIYRLA